MVSTQVSTIIFVTLIALAIGAALGLFLGRYSWFVNLISKKEREKQKLLSNPDYLLQKLESQGVYRDNIAEKEISYAVEEVEGKRVLKEVVSPINFPKPVPATKKVMGNQGHPKSSSKGS